MKRPKSTKQSPYQRYAKREYLYSPAYQAWAGQFRPIKPSQRRKEA